MNFKKNGHTICNPHKIFYKIFSLRHHGGKLFWTKLEFFLQCHSYKGYSTDSIQASEKWYCIMYSPLTKEPNDKTFRSSEKTAFCNLTSANWHFATFYPQNGILQPYIRKLAFCNLISAKWHFVTFYPQMAFCNLLSANWHFVTFYPQNGILLPFIRKMAFGNLSVKGLSVRWFFGIL